MESETGEQSVKRGQNQFVRCHKKSDTHPGWGRNRKPAKHRDFQKKKIPGRAVEKRSGRLVEKCEGEKREGNCPSELGDRVSMQGKVRRNDKSIKCLVTVGGCQEIGRLSLDCPIERLEKKKSKLADGRGDWRTGVRGEDSNGKKEKGDSDSKMYSGGNEV